MKRHSTSNLSNKNSMEVERSKLKEEPHIPSAHIRSLIKQLSSSRSRSNAPVIAGDHKHPQTRPDAEDSTTTQPKKQVRRRLNASRPYQERRLNMAEVRKEIVTALKFHRAAMKRSSEQEGEEEEEKLYQLPPSPLPHLSPFSFSSPSWTYPQLAPPPASDKLFSFPLPTQPLGLNLNLNFNGFNNVETPLFPNFSNSNSKSSSSTSTSTSSSSTAGMANMSPADQTLHRVMGDEEMEEIRSMSAKHDIEWNDIMNSVKTAWWSKLLKAMEAAGDGANSADGDGFSMFSEVAEMPEMDNHYLLEKQIDDQLQNVTVPW